MNLFNFYELCTVHVHLKSINNFSLVRTMNKFSPPKKHKQSNAHEKCKKYFPSENYNRKHHAHARAASA